jgi:uncharacterized protein (TIGR03437 family)
MVLNLEALVKSLFGKWSLLVVLAGAADAQTAANWTRQIPQDFPPPTFTHSMAYDSAHKQSVLFGGEISGSRPTTTWVWDGVNWTLESPQTSPPGRTSGAMAYDSAHGQVVLFGGDTSSATLNDTWVWDGTNWTQKSPQTSPPIRAYTAMAYDSAHGQVVMFGGLGLTTLNDTWVWDGVNWTQKFPQTVPPARQYHAMAYDSAHGQVVMFGGVSVTDTWVWDGTNWTQKSPQNIPSARSYPAMAYDSVHGVVVMFGGSDISTNSLGDTWEWDGVNWTQQSPQTSPSARFLSAMDYDSSHDQIVMFGGRGGSGLLGDTWTWDSGPIPVAISSVVSASAFGGFSSVAPGSWIEIYGSNLAPGTQGWTGSDFTGNNAPTSLGGVSVSIGGQAAFVNYVSALQVNAQLPSNIATGGMLQLTVTNGSVTSAPVNLTVNATEPGLLAPASFKAGSNQYVVAQHSDGSYVLPTGAISGIASSPAKPGETVVIYGVGFGSVIPSIPAGQIATETNQLSAPFEIMFGQTKAQLPYFGLAPSFVGLYQFNVTVPAVANNDLEPLTFTLGGAAGTQTLFTAVQQ